MIALAAFILFRAKPPFAPDVSVTLLSTTNASQRAAFTTQRKVEYEIVNRSDGSVRLESLRVENRPFFQGANPFQTLAAWSPAQRDIMHPGERRKIVLSLGSPRHQVSEFRGICTVTPVSNWLHDWIRRQPWSKKLFRILRPPPPPPSYSFSSAWLEAE